MQGEFFGNYTDYPDEKPSSQEQAVLLEAKSTKLAKAEKVRRKTKRMSYFENKSGRNHREDENADLWSQNRRDYEAAMLENASDYGLASRPSNEILAR